MKKWMILVFASLFTMALSMTAWSQTANTGKTTPSTQTPPANTDKKSKKKKKKKGEKKTETSTDSKKAAPKK